MASAMSQLYVPMNMNELGAGHLHHQAMLHSTGHALPSDEYVRHGSAQWDQQVTAFSRPYGLTEMEFNSTAVDFQTMSKIFAPDPSVMQLYEVTPAPATTTPMTRAVPLLDYQPPCPSVSESTPAPDIYSPTSQYMSPRPLYPSEHVSANALERRSSYATSYTTSSPGIHSQHTTPPPMPIQPYDGTMAFNFDTSTTNWDPNPFNWDQISNQTIGTPELSYNEESPAPEVVYPIPFELDFSQIPEDKRPEFPIDLSEYELVRLPCMPGVPVGVQAQQGQQNETFSFGDGSALDGWYSLPGEVGLGLGFGFDSTTPASGVYYGMGCEDELQRQTEEILRTCETFESLQAAGRKRKQQLLDSVAVKGGGKASKSNGSRKSPSASSTASKPASPPAPRTRRRSAVAKRPTKAATVQAA